MKMKAPDGVIDLSVEGVEYTIDENGCVDVPFHVAAELECHRFVQWIESKLDVKEIKAIEEPAAVEEPAKASKK